MDGLYTCGDKEQTLLVLVQHISPCLRIFCLILMGVHVWINSSRDSEWHPCKMAMISHNPGGANASYVSFAWRTLVPIMNANNPRPRC